MSWLAAVIKRVSKASSVAGKAFCPVCSHTLTSSSVVRSLNATGSAFRQRSVWEARDRPAAPGPDPGADATHASWRGLQLPVGDIADDTHCERRIDRENFF